MEDDPAGPRGARGGGVAGIVRKNVRGPVRCADRLKNLGYHATFVILGEGPDYNKLNNMIKAAHLEDTVLLLGFAKNPYPYFREADAYLCTSVAEGFSTTVSEAAVLGLPIITTSCAGMDEIAEVYNNIFISDNSTKAICSSVEGFLRIYSKNNAITGSFYIADYFNINTRIKEIEELLNA